MTPCKHGTYAEGGFCSMCYVEGLTAALDDLRAERDNARAIARVLAHSFEHDTRPPPAMVAEALAFPVKL